ncbi:glycosyltransferase [Rhizobium leguminosarum]|nr:glycosyltransferase [Rhizobium leguminosarum]TBG51992.1 glycosyltransferase [Rhizobium leguminosarum]TBH10140.1 glycosyltransferase [Rhizobium leguminosarum]TBH57378.1 glycosyltransferase [Rhizobium leguminosarum]
MLHHSITTMVRDAGRLGGGMADVALNVHSRLAALSVRGHFVCGIEPDHVVENVFLAGRNGEAFSSLAAGAFGQIAHIHGIWTAFEWRAYRAARKRGAKVAISPHGALEPWALNHKWLKKRLAWWAYQHSMITNADLLIVNSEQELGHLRALGFRGAIAVIANGVDIDTTSAGYGAEEGLREKVVLFLSRLTAKKGILDLLDAWHRLADKNGYSLHIRGFGESEYENILRRRIDELGEGPTVKLLPAVFGAEKWEAYRRASAYVLPSYSENFGITVAEAMIGGLPVITTKATPWSAVEPERLGWIVDNDVEQLQACLQTVVYMDSDALRDIGERARQFAYERFMWPRIIEKYIATYAWLGEPGDSPPPWVNIDH